MFLKSMNFNNVQVFTLLFSSIYQTFVKNNERTNIVFRIVSIHYDTKVHTESVLLLMQTITACVYQIRKVDFPCGLILTYISMDGKSIKVC